MRCVASTSHRRCRLHRYARVFTFCQHASSYLTRHSFALFTDLPTNPAFSPLPRPHNLCASVTVLRLGRSWAGSHVIFALQQTRRYKVISVDNHHNSSPKALERVAKLAREALPADASEQDKDSAEIDAHTADLTKPDQIRAVFAKYGKGGIWGVVHIAVRFS